MFLSISACGTDQITEDEGYILSPGWDRQFYLREDNANCIYKYHCSTIVNRPKILIYTLNLYLDNTIGCIDEYVKVHKTYCSRLSILSFYSPE